MTRIPVEWVDRYVAGRSSPAEQTLVEQWLAESPRRRVFVDTLQRGDGDDAPIPGARGEEATWALIRRRALERQERWKGAAGERARSPWLRARVLWSAVMAVALLVVAGLGWTVARSRSHVRHVTMTTYATGNGERATIVLPDGGTVALNVASRLDVPMDYMAGDRTVRLSGEGLFTVPHQAGAPFSVVAGGVSARVLGTSFVVRHYATDTTALVAVRDGKVAVVGTVVTAQRVAVIGQDGLQHLGPANASLFSFARGVLALDGVSLPQAIVELSRWYDADIRLGDPALVTRHVKGEFAAGSLSDLTAILEWTFNARVVRDGRVLTLYPR